MSVSPPPVPLPNPSALTNPIDPLWQQALGEPAALGGLRAQHLAQVLGTALPTLQSISFTVSAIPDAPFPAPSAAIQTTTYPDFSRTDTWTENGVSYYAAETDTAALAYSATLDSGTGQWTYTETLSSNYTITTSVISNGTQTPTTWATGDYSYVFSARGDASSSNFTFFYAQNDATVLRRPTTRAPTATI